MIKRFNVQHQKWLVYRKRAHRRNAYTRAPIGLLFHYATASWREGRDEYARKRNEQHIIIFYSQQRPSQTLDNRSPPNRS